MSEIDSFGTLVILVLCAIIIILVQCIISFICALFRKYVEKEEGSLGDLWLDSLSHMLWEDTY